MTEEDEKVFDVVYIKRIVVSVTAKKNLSSEMDLQKNYIL